MKILIETLFIALAVFPNSIESVSPRRLPGQVYKPKCAASTSYSSLPKRQSESERTSSLERSKSEVLSKVSPKVSPEVSPKEAKPITVTVKVPVIPPEMNPKGIFYGENGTYKPVKPGMRLIEFNKYIIGRPVNGFVGPVFNDRGEFVMAKQHDNRLQYVMDSKHAMNLCLFQRIPPFCNEVEAGIPPSATDSEQRSNIK